MVENDIEDDLEASPMKRLDQVTEFIDRAQGILSGAISDMRRKE
jgi:hypothetical protein